MTVRPKTLILGWGNPGRGDDGLGPACVSAMAELRIPGVEVDTDYQLQVEDAAEVARFHRVIFVDADRSGAEPFSLQRLGAAGRGASFSTHSVSPGTILALARDLFQSEPEAWILGIRGYEFDKFGEGLSVRGRSNLDQAIDCLKSVVTTTQTPNDLEGDPWQTTNP
jgi:hydrogenase maturation protease